ncbi:uncharacterized protein LOC112900569 [Panicum hallii]|uniref:uncharacterized protein LOC112900569 n=1 Tax=Panicum hallii TaxID=206008 RepID=UPI000DF4CF14|nr:uncharacterized protein LOC112900569 [Panicum hallii]
MMSRFNKKGYNYDPKKNKFRTRRNKEGGNKKCYNCGKYDHISYDCPEPSRINKKHEDEGNQYKHKKKDYEKSDHKKKSFKKREQIKALLGEWITDGETSSDDSSDDDSKKKIAGIAINDDEPPLPPPPMCLMARGNSKVSDDEHSSRDDDSDNDLLPNELRSILEEYTDVIKKYKSKCKSLEGEHIKLKASYDELLVRHNEHYEVVLLNKSLESCNKKLKLDYGNLNMKYQELEFAFDAIDDELEIA